MCRRQREPQPDGCCREPTSVRHRFLIDHRDLCGFSAQIAEIGIVFGCFECHEQFVARRECAGFEDRSGDANWLGGDLAVRQQNRTSTTSASTNLLECEVPDFVLDSNPVLSRHGTTVHGAVSSSESISADPCAASASCCGRSQRHVLGVLLKEVI